MDSLIRPKDFYNDIKGERGLKNPIVFLIVVTFVTLTFLTYYYLDLFNSYLIAISDMMAIQGSVPFQIEMTFTTYLTAYIILGVSFFLISFLWYYLTHVFVRLMGGKHGYDQTYKAMSYSLSADYLIFPGFIMLVLTGGRLLLERTTLWKVLFVVANVLYFTPAFYRLYLRLVAIEKLQEITKWKAFLAAYVFAYLCLFGIVIAVDLLLIGLYLFIQFLK